jgi:hypothetical protein
MKLIYFLIKVTLYYIIITFIWGFYWVYRAQVDWTLIHMNHKDTEQSTIEASSTLDGVTLTDSLIR